MPNESLSVYLTAKDGMSPVLASITDKTKALDKESQELQQTFEALQKANKGLIERKTELKRKLQEVNDEVKEAEKSFKKLGDEANSDAYEKAQERQQKLRDEIAATNKALRENQKTYKENIETIRKGDLEGQGTSLSDMAKGIFAGQIGQMFSASRRPDGHEQNPGHLRLQRQGGGQGLYAGHPAGHRRRRGGAGNGDVRHDRRGPGPGADEVQR